MRTRVDPAFAFRTDPSRRSSQTRSGRLCRNFLLSLPLTRISGGSTRAATPMISSPCSRDCAQTGPLPGTTNWGRKARKKVATLGLSRSMKTPWQKTEAAPCGLPFPEISSESPSERRAWMPSQAR